MNPLGIVKAVGGPGSIGFLAVNCAVALAIIRLSPRRRRLGRAWLLVVFVIYVVLSVPLVANAIGNRLQPAHEPTIGDVDVVVLFDGDNRVGRVRTVARWWSTHRNGLLLVSGEDWLIEHLEQAGVPPRRIVHDGMAKTTQQQMLITERFLRERHLHRAAIVVSRLQAPRVVALARASGAPVTIIGAPVDIEPATSGYRVWVPAYAALRVSRDALYEHAALRYYEWRGWTPAGSAASAFSLAGASH